MVDITPNLTQGAQRIESYGGGGFLIAGVRYQGSVLVFPGRTVAWNIADDMKEEDFAQVEGIELLLIGCGAEHPLPMPAIKALLRDKKINSEWMTTAAACRTYNVLLAEGRSVAAALIAV